MSTYALTGSASGMGRATAERLRAAGHTVIGVDLRDADVIADLSTDEGRKAAAEAVLDKAKGRLDGAVLAAGIGPGPGRTRLLGEVNYRGAVDLLRAWQPALAKAGSAKVVLFSSNSTTTTPMVPASAVKALLNDDVDKAARIVSRLMGKNAPSIMYGTSKIAVTRWMRRTAVTPEWAGSGIRLNAIAPGAIMTPLLQSQLDDPALAPAIEAFPVPTGGFGDADEIAQWVEFMLSPAANFMAGSVVFVDGGTDAYFRSDDWPRSVPLGQLSRYLKLMKHFASRSK